jgi:serine protease SohB
MEFLSQYGLFLLKAITIVIAILAIFGGIFSMSRKSKPKLEVISLSEHYDDLHSLMHKEILGEKLKKSKDKKSKTPKPTLFVIDFNGDLKASQVEQLREEITAILAVAKAGDEIFLRLESPGGAVNGYGLAAAQLQRIRDKDIHLTVAIDKVAASGGYLMACVANHIMAAPFSIIGSIGVVAQIPNFHRWLEKNGIDVELLTAGEYKRTLTLFAQNTSKGRKKFQEDLERIHGIFRQYVLENRAQLPSIDEVATGEHWLAVDAKALHLVDELSTSDEYLCRKTQDYKIFKVVANQKTKLLDRILNPAMRLLHPWG